MVYPVTDLYEYLTRGAIVGLFVWVFVLQGKIATFVTQKDLQDTMGEVRKELTKIVEDLAYLKGKSES